MHFSVTSNLVRGAMDRLVGQWDPWGTKETFGESHGRIKCMLNGSS